VRDQLAVLREAVPSPAAGGALYGGLSELSEILRNRITKVFWLPLMPNSPWGACTCDSEGGDPAVMLRDLLLHDEPPGCGNGLETMGDEFEVLDFHQESSFIRKCAGQGVSRVPGLAS